MICKKNLPFVVRFHDAWKTLGVVKTYFYFKLKLTTPTLQSESNKSGTFFVNWSWESREDIILAESNNWDTKRHTHKLQQHSPGIGVCSRYLSWFIVISLHAINGLFGLFCRFMGACHVIPFVWGPFSILSIP